MANFERNARSDDVRVFDGAEDEEDVEGSRLPLLIVIALFVLAAFGGVVWLAYQHGLAQGHSEVPRVIAAEPGPAKVAPADAGGTPTPNTGLKIYQQPAPSDEEANADTVPSNDAMKPQPAPAQQQAAAPPTPKPAAVTPPPTPKPAAATPAPAPPKPATQAAATPAPKPAPPPVAKPVETASDTPPATAAPTGGALLQIGAYKSRAEAEAAWASYKAKHASVVGDLTSDIKEVDLGAKGTWYRLRVVASKAEASSICDKLKAEGGACIPSK